MQHQKIIVSIYLPKYYIDFFHTKAALLKSCSSNIAHANETSLIILNTWIGGRNLSHYLSVTKQKGLKDCLRYTVATYHALLQIPVCIYLLLPYVRQILGFFNGKAVLDLISPLAGHRHYCKVVKSECV